MTRRPRWVLDTNVVVAALLWNGPPRRLLDFAIEARLDLFASRALISELLATLRYSKFASRIRGAGTNPEALVDSYVGIVQLIEPETVARVVKNDPADDHVLACAITAKAEAIVSGDHHLLDLREHCGILIKTARAALDELDQPH